MRMLLFAAVALALAATLARGENTWYRGDECCPPPRDDGTYSAPYNALEHRDYPTFEGADRPGWFCSYQRQDGVIVQYGDSRTPQEQWLAVWGDMHKD